MEGVCVLCDVTGQGLREMLRAEGSDAVTAGSGSPLAALPDLCARSPARRQDKTESMLSWGVHPTWKRGENHKCKPRVEVKMSRRHIGKVSLKEVNEINFSTALWVTRYLE